MVETLTPKDIDIGGSDGEDFKLPLLSDYLEKEIIIKEIRFGSSQFGEYAVVTLDNGVEVRSANMVVLTQLHKIEENTPEGSLFKCKVTQVKKYLMLAE